MSNLIDAVYVRVSSKSQDVASQMPDLERWTKANGSNVKIYKDTFTGKSMDRKGWNRLEADYKAGKVGRIIIWRLDRLGRTARGLTALFEELNSLKIALVSLREGFDLSTPGGRLFANMLASVAQYETEVRSERQLAGIAVAMEKGVKFGRPAVGDGNGKKIKVTPEQERQVRRLASEGAKKAAIARAVGLSRPTVYSVLAKPLYTVVTAGGNTCVIRDES
jgi:DNA invertase Pin-like site-specific DNA recombinase